MTNAFYIEPCQYQDLGKYTIAEYNVINGHEIGGHIHGWAKTKAEANKVLAQAKRNPRWTK